MNAVLAKHFYFPIFFLRLPTEHSLITVTVERLLFFLTVFFSALCPFSSSSHVAFSTVHTSEPPSLVVGCLMTGRQSTDGSSGLFVC